MCVCQQHNHCPSYEVTKTKQQAEFDSDKMYDII